MQAIVGLSLEQLVERIKNRQIKARDVMMWIYNNIERYNGQLNVFRSLVDRSRAMQWAESIDEKADKEEAFGKTRRNSGRSEGQHCRSGSTTENDLRLTDFGKLSSAFQCNSRGKVAPGRCIDHRHDQYG